jgi:tetratricopeptide (TPR) repeat protein
VRHGHAQEAENLIASARARFPNDAPVWRVAAGFFHARLNRESLRLLYLDAAERGLMADERLRELRLTALVDAATEGVRGGPTSLATLASFEGELAWLEGRSPAHAFLAATARTIPMLARAVTSRGTPEAAASEAAMRNQVDGLLNRFKDMPDAWRLAVAGHAALRALETESGALLKRLATAPAAVRPQVESWLRLADLAYALRARKAGAVTATTKALEQFAAKARGRVAPPSEHVLRGASVVMQRSLAGKAAPDFDKARKHFEAALAVADATTAAGRLEQQAAMVGLAAVETAAGRKDAAIAAWKAVRAQREYPYLNALAAGWSLLLQGGSNAMYAAEFFLRAAHEAMSPHESNYAYVMVARALRDAGKVDSAATFAEKAAAVATEAGLAAEVVPATGMRVVFVSGMRISLTAGWDAPLFADIAVDPVVALLPSP